MLRTSGYHRAPATATAAAQLLLICWFVLSPPSHAMDAANCGDLEHRFDLIQADVASDQLDSALFSAAEMGCQELARKLLTTGAQLEARDRLGATPLAHAARAGQLAMAKFLLAEGAQIDARDISGATALYDAANDERQATVALLVAKGADLDLPGRSGLTPLAIAASKGNDRIVEQLLSRKANPNVVDVSGKSAMTHAAVRAFAEVVRRLLDAGVDANLRYGNDLTALMWAAGYEDGVGVPAAISVVDLLLKAGSQFDAVDGRGRTALMIAADLGHAEIADILIERGADRNVRDRAGKTALDLAADDNVRRILALDR
jgi:ankyrin repeat protein